MNSITGKMARMQKYYEDGLPSDSPTERECVTNGFPLNESREHKAKLYADYMRAQMEEAARQIREMEEYRRAERDALMNPTARQKQHQYQSNWDQFTFTKWRNNI